MNIKQSLTKYFSRNLQKRIGELDILRFVAILLMTFSHLTYTMRTYAIMWDGYSYIAPRFYEFLDFGYYWFRYNNVFIYVPCGTLFLIVSGITTSFSRNPWRKSLKFAVIASLITAVTFTLTQISGSFFTILFGIIHLHAAAMAIYAAVDTATKKYNKKINIIVLAIVGLGFLIPGLIMNNYYYRPNASHDYFFIFGFLSGRIGSADYYPLLPWAGIFVLGACLGKLLYPQRRSYFPCLSHKSMRPINFIAAYSLEYFFIHSPVIFLVLGIIGLILGMPLY